MIRLRIQVGGDYLGTVYADRTDVQFGRLLAFSGDTCIAVLGTKDGVEIRVEEEKEKEQ